MEQEQLKQFTFYELYADILSGLNDLEAGKFAKRICEYEFGNVEPIIGLPFCMRLSGKFLGNFFVKFS